MYFTLGVSLFILKFNGQILSTSVVVKILVKLRKLQSTVIGCYRSSLNLLVDQPCLEHKSWSTSSFCRILIWD